LAGGIAHEFNNYLGVIMGYSDLLGQDENQSESVRQTVAEINTATQRAASLTRQLLAFSRKQMLEPTVLDLNKSIHETHKLLRRLIPADIDIIPVLQPDLGRVRADPVQIQRILINLAVNARDAMPQGGKISIETVEVVLDEEFASLHPDIPQGDYVMLSVTDTGEGMDAETLSHIFEPFFTTKKEGKGTGLGLSTTYGIVKQSGGHVTVASVRGRGTTFRVYLPKLAAENSSSAVVLSEPAVHEREPIHEPALHTSGTILLVEDEPALRKLMRGALEREGYTIVEAKDGAEALSICEQNPAIGLIVSDLAMPQMTGLELREKVAVMCPNMKFLLISGYVKDVVISPEQVAKFAEFLEKPFRPNELTQKVRELLTRTSGKQEEARGGNTLPEASHDKSGPGNDPRLN